MYKHLINSAANRCKAWLERIAIGDQDSVFELFVSAAIMTSITFTFLSPNEIVRFINAISTITLVGTLAAHFGRAFNRDALMAVSFCTAVFEMAVSVFYHGGKRRGSLACRQTTAMTRSSDASTWVCVPCLANQLTASNWHSRWRKHYGRNKACRSDKKSTPLAVGATFCPLLSMSPSSSA